MNILLLLTAYNSLSQGVHTKLKDDKHNIDILFISDIDILNEINKFNPDIILCPFLKTYLPKNIYEKYPTFIFHPAPIGDRGFYSLDWAIFNQEDSWGYSWIKANGDYDGGDIYENGFFKVKSRTKACLYRKEITKMVIKSLDNLLINIKNNTSISQVLNPMHKKFTQDIRQINWQKDNTKSIILKINCSDSTPGVLDNILGIDCFLFGACKEDKLQGNIKEILAKRDGAICIGTIDGAVWISHIKSLQGFKLPSTYVLKDKLKGIKEDRLPLVFDKSYNTFYEISIEKKDNIIYLFFDFYNGCMSVAQCVRLKYAIEYLKDECDILVLMGGEEFFSNGIHLNILEDSDKQGEDGWANINAMNDLISSILYADDIITISSFTSNAGAGGVYMGLACDYVVGIKDVILNPHYQTMGLSGSEYHNWILSKRVGKKIGEDILNNCLPLSISQAKDISLIDYAFKDVSYHDNLYNFIKDKYNDDYILNKQEYLELNKEEMELSKEQELSIMYDEFWDKNSSFHKSRYDFVHKTKQLKTPSRLRV